MWQWVLLIIVLWILYIGLKSESFDGVNPNDVIRIMAVIKRFPKGPATLSKTHYALFSQAILPTAVHEWTFQELQNISANGMLNTPNVRFLLELDAKFKVHPAYAVDGSGIFINYPRPSPPPQASRFVMNIGTPAAPKWVVSTN